MGEPLQQVDFNGIQYSPITFEEVSGHTKIFTFRCAALPLDGQASRHSWNIQYPPVDLHP